MMHSISSPQPKLSSVHLLQPSFHGQKPNLCALGLIPPVLMLHKLHAAAKYKTSFSQRKPTINQRRYLLGGTKSSFSGSLPWKKKKISQTFPCLHHTWRSRSTKDTFYTPALGKINAEVTKVLKRHQNGVKETKDENQS